MNLLLQLVSRTNGNQKYGWGASRYPQLLTGVHVVFVPIEKHHFPLQLLVRGSCFQCSVPNQNETEYAVQKQRLLH
jgi:hypothetical protein